MTALQPLLAQLSSGNDYLAENAAAKLYAHGQPAFAALCQLRQSPDPDQRWWAVRASRAGDSGERQGAGS